MEGPRGASAPGSRLSPWRSCSAPRHAGPDAAGRATARRPAAAGAAGPGPTRAQRARSVDRRAPAGAPRHPLQERHRLLRTSRARQRRADGVDRSDERTARRRPQVAHHRRSRRRPGHRHHLQHRGADRGAAAQAAAAVGARRHAHEAARGAARRARRGPIRRRRRRRTDSERRPADPRQRGRTSGPSTS